MWVAVVVQFGRRPCRCAGADHSIHRRCRFMASDKRIKIVLACSECKQRNYNTIKNKKNDPDRLEMSKYCRFCKKHTSHKEAK